MNKVYHFHLAVHEEVTAETEEEARAELERRWPVDFDRFELSDVQDTVKVPCAYCGKVGCGHQARTAEHLRSLRV